MARIILSSVGQGQDVLPFAHLAGHLSALGHEPVLITNSRFVEQLEAATIPVLAVDKPGDYERLEHEQSILKDPLSLPAFFRRHYLPTVPRECDLIREHVAPDGTVLVANEIPGIAARIMAQTCRVPLISVFTSPAQIAATRLYPELFDLMLSHDVNLLINREGWIGRDDMRSWWWQPRDGIALWTDSGPIDCWPCRAVAVGAIDSVAPDHSALAKAADVLESVFRRSIRAASEKRG